jgi:hypothetical protein
VQVRNLNSCNINIYEQLCLLCTQITIKLSSWQNNNVLWWYARLLFFFVKIWWLMLFLPWNSYVDILWNITFSNTHVAGRTLIWFSLTNYRTCIICTLIDTQLLTYSMCFTIASLKLLLQMQNIQIRIFIHEGKLTPSSSIIIND